MPRLSQLFNTTVHDKRRSHSQTLVLDTLHSEKSPENCSIPANQTSIFSCREILKYGSHGNIFVLSYRIMVSTSTPFSYWFFRADTAVIVYDPDNNQSTFAIVMNICRATRPPALPVGGSFLARGGGVAS